MKLSSINCPNCGGTINADVSKSKYIFCTYCGQQLEIDDGVRETKHTQNININKKVKIHKQYTNDADVIREQNKIKEVKYTYIAIFACIGILFLTSFGCYMMSYMPKAIGRSEGKISAGFYRDLVGENYQYVESTLEAAGFTNIELIDLDDQGLFKKDGEVTSVSVGGNTSFDSLDYFDKDVKVVITYH